MTTSKYRSRSGVHGAKYIWEIETYTVESRTDFIWDEAKWQLIKDRYNRIFHWSGDEDYDWWDKL